MYYLESRYYHPEIYRFINADSVVSGAGRSIHGYNLFIYCLNNSVNMLDTTGHWSEWIEKFINQVNEKIIKPVRKFVNDISTDFKNYDWNNNSEEKVLQANYFSSYKGVPVIRINGERSGSFGMIFLTREFSENEDPRDVVRHEYGHAKQLRQLDIITYAAGIGFPSWKKMGKKPYYDKPWEITADIYGGVEYRNHSQNNIDDGFKCLGVLKVISAIVHGVIGAPMCSEGY